MNLKQLEAFLWVADLKSFTGAAKQLFMSQPAVSFQIKSLEDELQVSLFQRNEKKVILTEAGSLLYPGAKEILRQHYKVIEDIDNLKGLKTGQLNIGASTIPGEYILPLFVGGFCQIHPGIKISLRIGGSGKVVNWVNNKEVALGITGMTVDGKGLECEPWIDDELVLIGPALVPGQLKKEIKLENLKKHSLILREQGSGTRETVESRLQKRGIPLGQCRVAIELGSTRSVITAVQAGLGLSFVSRWAAKELLQLGTIREIPMPELDLKRKLYLVRNAQALGGGFAATVFIDYMKDSKKIAMLGHY